MCCGTVEKSETNIKPDKEHNNTTEQIYKTNVANNYNVLSLQFS